MDTQWANDPGVKEYSRVHEDVFAQCRPEQFELRGRYHYANLLMKGAQGCKDDFSRDNIMRRQPRCTRCRCAAVAGNDGIDRRRRLSAIPAIAAAAFDGKSWVGFGDILDDR